MEPWEHPAEQAQAGLLAPAGRVALARVGAGSLLRPADEGEDHVADRQSENQPLHPMNVAAAEGDGVRGGDGPSTVSLGERQDRSAPRLLQPFHHRRDIQPAAKSALKPITQRSVHPRSALNRALPPARAALTSSRISPPTPTAARTVATARMPSSSTSRQDTGLHRPSLRSAARANVRRSGDHHRRRGAIVGDAACRPHGVRRGFAPCTYRIHGWTSPLRTCSKPASRTIGSSRWTGLFCMAGLVTGPIR
jgi:hypothetical protein